MWELMQTYLVELEPTKYSVAKHSQGIPQDVIWRERVLRKANGYVHCSGATWWLLVALLRLFEQEANLTVEQINDMRKWAWCEGDRIGGLPEAICNYELGQYVATNDLQQGDFVQIWRLDGSGHSFVFAGKEEDGSWMEWSASALHDHGTGIKKVWGQDQLKEVFAARLHDSFWR